MLFANQREHFQHSGTESREGAVTEETERQGKVSELLIWGRPRRISNFWSSSWRELRLQYRVTSPKLQIQQQSRVGNPCPLGPSPALSLHSPFVFSAPQFSFHRTPIHTCAHAPARTCSLPLGRAAGPVAFTLLLWSTFLGACLVALLCNLLRSSCSAHWPSTPVLDHWVCARHNFPYLEYSYILSSPRQIQLTVLSLAVGPIFAPRNFGLLILCVHVCVWVLFSKLCCCLEGKD